MKRIKMHPVSLRAVTAAFAAALVAAFAAAPAAAQDAAIVNARIIVGNGTVIDSGTLIVRDGKIASVSAGTPSAADTQGLQQIDAHGMTAIPGYIDAHKHINSGPNEKEQMQDLLEAGYTTVLAGGGPAEGTLALRDHIESGQINGPRVIPSGSVPARKPGAGRIGIGDITPDEARAQIRALAAMGVKWTGEIALTPVPGPSPQEIAALRAAVDEGKKVGVTVQVHAVSTPAMVAAVDAGVRRLVHVPNKDWVSHDAAQKLTDTGTRILATIGFGAPIFGVFADDNAPRFRNGEPWPESIAGANRDAAGRVMGNESGYTMVNTRLLWDHGVEVGYCTDSGYEATAGLRHELESYNVMFSMRDIVELMGPNTAAYIDMGDQLGTLEAGKLADIVLVDGNPMDGYWNMLNPKVVLKAGKVVVDKR